MPYTIFLNSLCCSCLIAVTAIIIAGFLNRVLLPRLKYVNYLFIPLFLCFFIPPIAVGYGYVTVSYNLIQFPILHNLLYSLIMIGRLVGPAAILLFYIPSSLSDESKHCMRIVAANSRSNRFVRSSVSSSCQHKTAFLPPATRHLTGEILYLARLYCSNMWRYTSVFIFLLLAAFSDFELASIMNINHWSVSLFDAHAQGISVLGSLKVNWLPFLLQLIMIIILLFALTPLGRILGTIHRTTSSKNLSPKDNGYSRAVFNFYLSNISSIRFHLALFFFALCLTVSAIFPIVVILKSAIGGGFSGFLNLWMLKEILNSLLFAIFATFAAYLIALLLNHFSLMKYKIILLLIFLPALIGILPLSLLVLQLFQLPIFNFLYNSPLPLLLTLILWALPFTLILRIIADAFIKDESLHSGRLTLPFSSRIATQLLWKMRFVKTAWILFFVFTLTYFNFTAATILAPVGMTTVTERFYNLMHYGESEKLSATVCVTMMVPLLLFIIFVVIFKFIIKKWYSPNKL